MTSKKSEMIDRPKKSKKATRKPRVVQKKCDKTARMMRNMYLAFLAKKMRNPSFTQVHWVYTAGLPEFQGSISRLGRAIQDCDNDRMPMMTLDRVVRLTEALDVSMADIELPQDELLKQLGTSKKEIAEYISGGLVLELMRS